MLGVWRAAPTAEPGPRMQVHDHPSSSKLTLADAQKLRQQVHAHTSA